MRSYLRIAIDLIWVGMSPFLAVFIRDNFEPGTLRLQAAIPYAFLCVAAAVIVIFATRLHKRVWRYTSLIDGLHLMAAMSVVLLMALAASFALNRLENVSRSLPAIQWLLLVSAMIATRVALRIWHERAGVKPWVSDKLEKPVEHVLIVGVNDITELYLRTLAEFAPADIRVVGILCKERSLHGRLIRLCKILGAPENIQQVLAQLEIHGITVDRIAVMQPFEQLPRAAREALSAVERSSAIKVDWLIEILGLRQGRTLDAQSNQETVPLSAVAENEHPSPGRYHYVKRTIDIAAASCLIIALTPIMVLVGLLVAVDVGFPLVFWQQRPGRYGRPFKLIKFRTMRAAHDAGGNRIPDQLRCSSIGHFLRWSWLDELPQLYNILVGEMSFVGPRPLLPLDQPKSQRPRLRVRPGLTGWAQVNGGRDISPEEKATLDIWYITNASFWLDIAILLRTFVTMVLRKGADGEAVKAAHVEPKKMTIGIEGARAFAINVPPLSASGAQESL
jgi:lipopolysaccharide/colanic/teichoic acid biosynthesis glycosyltransferase